MGHSLSRRRAFGERKTPTQAEGRGLFDEYSDTTRPLEIVGDQGLLVGVGA